MKLILTDLLANYIKPAVKMQTKINIHIVLIHVFYDERLFNPLCYKTYDDLSLSGFTKEEQSRKNGLCK